MASTGNVLELVLLTLQAFQVVFLWIHDWVPLGCLNDVAAVRSQDTLLRLAIVTLVQSVPYTVGLFFSARYFGGLTRAGSISGCGSVTESYSLVSSAPGGYPIFFGWNRSGPSVSKQCSVTRTHSCRSTMGLSPTPRISCFI